MFLYKTALAQIFTHLHIHILSIDFLPLQTPFLHFPFLKHTLPKNAFLLKISFSNGKQKEITSSCVLLRFQSETKREREKQRSRILICVESLSFFLLPDLAYFIHPARHAQVPYVVIIRLAGTFPPFYGPFSMEKLVSSCP